MALIVSYYLMLVYCSVVTLSYMLSSDRSCLLYVVPRKLYVRAEEPGRIEPELCTILLFITSYSELRLRTPAWDDLEQSCSIMFVDATAVSYAWLRVRCGVISRGFSNHQSSLRSDDGTSIWRAAQ